MKTGPQPSVTVPTVCPDCHRLVERFTDECACGSDPSPDIFYHQKLVWYCLTHGDIGPNGKTCWWRAQALVIHDLVETRDEDPGDPLTQPDAEAECDMTYSRLNYQTVK